MLNKADKEVFDVTMAEVKRGYNVSGSTVEGNELLDELILRQVEYKLDSRREAEHRLTILKKKGRR
ncbi:MAG TPA: hypothetical protein VMW50_12590 [Dehalococcoidia bacterium]|nr:hypothetical protein [Dehalococcoidia bacterium]